MSDLTSQQRESQSELPANEKADLADMIRSESKQRGFDLVGICNSQPSDHLDKLHAWIDAGFHGEMSYLADRKEAYSSPDRVLSGTQSIVMLGLAYRTGTKTQTVQNERTGQGRVAAYASSKFDYHDIIHRKLKSWLKDLRIQFPNDVFRGVVDSAPLLERDYAQLAGLGWIGKNTLLISPTAGSYFFLAALLTSLVLAPDKPFESDHCGSCTRCLEACPTDAFVDAHKLDARKCISYLTIESKKAAPPDLARLSGDWIFGCDVCQDVCPWNRKPQHAPNADLIHLPIQELSSNDIDVDSNERIALKDILTMNAEQFRARFRKTPMWRSKLEGLQRNAINVAVNQQLESLLPEIQKIATSTSDPMLRSVASQAIDELDSNE